MRHHHISSGSLGGSNVAPIKARLVLLVLQRKCISIASHCML